MLFRALFIWMVMAEDIHGIIRVRFLYRRDGDNRA